MVQQIHSNVFTRRVVSRIGAGVAALVVSLAGAFGAASQVSAASPIIYTEYPFTQSELTNWVPDRTAPSGGFSSVSYGGRSDVLKLGIDTTKASANPGFYHTEGLQRALPDGSVAIRADVYVPSSWEATKVRAGLWGVGVASDKSISSYPIIEFTTIGDGGYIGWRWWDGDNGGWTNLPGVSYKTDEWNKLAIAMNGNSFDFYVNGKWVANYASPDSVGLSAAILNSYNSADQSTNYDVYWSRFAAGYGSPATKAQCLQNGWVTYGFSNQGQCVRFVENGKDSRL